MNTKKKFAYGDAMLMFGGATAMGKRTRSRPAVPAPHAPLTGPAFVSDQEVMAGKSNDVWRFDPHIPSWTSMPARGVLPSRRSRHAMACSERYIYMFGGSNGSGEKRTNVCLIAGGCCLLAVSPGHACAELSVCL